MRELSGAILSFVGAPSLTAVTYTYRGHKRTTPYFAEMLKSVYPQRSISVFLSASTFAKHEPEIYVRMGVRSLQVPSGPYPHELWAAFNVVSDAVSEGSRVIVDLTDADKTQALLALAACAYMRAARDVKVEEIVGGAPYTVDPEVHPTQDLTPLLEFIDWSKATEQFLRYGNALPLRDRLLDAQFDDPTEQGALHRLAKQLERLTESMALLRPVETLDEAKGIRESVQYLKEIVHEIPEAQPIEPLLSRIQTRFEPFSDVDKLTASEGFVALAHMIRVYLQTEHYVEGITLAREALVTKVCAIERWHGLDERFKAEDKLNDFAAAFRDKKALPGSSSRFGKLWACLSDLRNDISHAGFREYPIEARQAILDIRICCDDAIALLTS